MITSLKEGVPGSCYNPDTFHRPETDKPFSWELLSLIKLYLELKPENRPPMSLRQKLTAVELLEPSVVVEQILAQKNPK